MTIKPMLAAQFDENKVLAHLQQDGFLWTQPKIDGMRVLVSDACIPLSRSGKEWKNKPLRKFLSHHPRLRYMDGEVVPGHVYHEGSFREAMSGTRAEAGSRDFTYFIFDYFHGSVTDYASRMAAINTTLMTYETVIEDPDGEYCAKLVMTPTFEVQTLDQVYEYEEMFVAQGWEGSMLRRNGLDYKHGRATALEGRLTKIKRFEDAEAVVIGYEPWYRNENDAVESPLGFTTRSSHQENLVPLERLGAWKCELLTDRSIKFDVGVMRGITHADRDRFWANRDAYIGRIFKFKHQGYGGGYDKPRSPVFLNFRSNAEF